MPYLVMYISYVTEFSNLDHFFGIISLTAPAYLAALELPSKCDFPKEASLTLLLLFLG